MNILDSPRHLAGAIVILLGVGIAIALSPFAVGLLGIVVLYVLVEPVHVAVSRRIGRGRSALLLLVLVALLVLLPGGFLVGLVIEQAPSAIRGIQSNSIFTWLSAQRIGEFDVGAQLAKASGSMLQWLSAQAFDIFGSAAHGTINFLISLFGLYFVLRSDGSTWVQVRRVLPFSDANIDVLRDRFVKVTHATFLGMLATAAVQGVLVGGAFAIVGLPGPLFWGVVTAVCSIIPLIGGALVWLPGVLVLLVQKDYGNALLLTFVGAVLVSNIDNVVRPWIYRRMSNIHPVVTLVGALAGLRYFGLLGVLLGPLAITYFFELLRIYDEEYAVSASARAAVQASGQFAAGASAPVSPPAPEPPDGGPPPTRVP